MRNSRVTAVSLSTLMVLGLVALPVGLASAEEAPVDVVTTTPVDSTSEATPAVVAPVVPAAAEPAVEAAPVAAAPVAPAPVPQPEAAVVDEPVAPLAKVAAPVVVQEIVAPAPVVDTTKPSVPVTSVPASLNPSKSSIVIQATDDANLAKITANIRKDSNSGALVKSTSSVVSGTSASHTVDLSGLADGVYNVRYNASDAAGNVSNTENATFRIDTTKPKVEFKNDTAVINGQYKTVNFKLSDAGKIDYDVVNTTKLEKSNNVYSDQNSVSVGKFGGVAGLNSIYAVDEAGNQSDPVYFNLDNTGPSITVKPEQSVGSNGVFQSVSFKLADVSNVTKTILNGVVKTLTPNPYSDHNFIAPGAGGAVEGLNTLIAEDGHGFQSTVTFTLDVTKPTVSATIPATLNNTKVTKLAIQASDNLGLAKIVANVRDASGTIVKPTQSAVSGLNATHEVDITGLAEGVYTVRFNALDAAGNMSSTQNITFAVDLTGPKVTWQLQPLAFYAIGDGYHVRPITDEVGTLKAVYVDAVAPENLVWSLNSDHKNFDTSNGSNQALWNSLSDGQHAFVAVFTDPAGNSTVSNSNTFVIDRTVPVVVNESQVWQTKDGGRTSVTLTFSESVSGLPQGWTGSGTKWTKVFYNTKDHVASFTDVAGNTASYTVKPVGAPDFPNEGTSPVVETPGEEVVVVIPSDPSDNAPSEVIGTNITAPTVALVTHTNTGARHVETTNATLASTGAENVDILTALGLALMALGVSGVLWKRRRIQ